MNWIWQQKEWPNFEFKKETLHAFETRFIHASGIFLGLYTHLHEPDKKAMTIELISSESIKTSEIEGEYLSRDSVQISIARYFGLLTDHRKIEPAEQGISSMMIDLYDTFAEPLSHTYLWNWHSLLMNGRLDLNPIGAYRSQENPMQIVSGPIGDYVVHFEAPPSQQLSKEMSRFIDWFNNTSPEGINPLPALTRAGIAHLYFECIHPFEDGNGRIGRAISEKSLAQSLGHPSLLSISQTILKNRKEYYRILGLSNRSLDISDWLEYFATTILEAQQYTQKMCEFIIKKTKLYDRARSMINPRQEKVLARIFREGLEGLKGGLSAENYIAITKTSRATATRDLQDLLAKEVLIRTGEKKSTRYFLNMP